MIDLKLNELFDFELDERNDAPFVTGVDAFNQLIALTLVDYLSETFNSTDKRAVLMMLQRQAYDVARDHPEYFQNVEMISVEWADETQTEVTLTVVYQTEPDFTTTL